MRAVSILLAIAVLALLAATQTSYAITYEPYLTYAAIAAGVLLVVAQCVFVASRAVPPPPVATAAQPAAPPPAANQAEAEVVSFLATLQEKGRFVDFLMEDITVYNDAQVSAAARVVHDGCRGALQEHFKIAPIRTEEEGAGVSVPAGFAADEYRLVGKISGEAPFAGTLVHKGWRTESVKLPRVLRPSGDRLPTIAPAEVELS